MRSTTCRCRARWRLSRCRRCPSPAPASTWRGRATCSRSSPRTSRPGWPKGGQPPALDLEGLAGDALRVLNESLGEGEVSAIVDAGPEIRIQEAVFSGVWREQHFDADGALLHDYLLAAPIPPVVTGRARERGAPTPARARAAGRRDERAGTDPRVAGGDGQQRPRDAGARDQPDAAAAVARGRGAPRPRARRRVGGRSCRAASATAASAARRRATSGACSTSTTCRR